MIATSTSAAASSVAITIAMIAFFSCVAATTAQSATCSSYQELELYYGSSSCGGNWYFWGNGTCYSESAIYFSVDGETWGTGFSAMFVANYDNVAASTWSFFGDNACQKRLHGIDGLSCSSCIANPSGWILSIGSNNITGFNIVTSSSATSVKGDGSHTSNRRQGRPTQQ